jgi:hypothetical protein
MLLLFSEVTPLAIAFPQDTMENLARGRSWHLFIFYKINRFRDLISCDLPSAVGDQLELITPLIFYS